MTPRQLQIEYTAIAAIRPDPLNPRLHSPEQLKQLVASTRRFGFTNPFLTDSERHVVASHGRLEAARLAGLASVPIIRLGALTEPERRALMVADNRLAETSCWDPARLQEVMQNLVALDVVVDDLGFDPGELDRVLGHNESAAIVDEADLSKRRIRQSRRSRSVAMFSSSPITSWPAWMLVTSARMRLCWVRLRPS